MKFEIIQTLGRQAYKEQLMRTMGVVLVVGAVLLVVFATCSGGAEKAVAQASRPATTGSIMLELAVVADANEPTLLLTVRNVGPSEVAIPELGEKGNAVTVIEPGGTGGESAFLHRGPMEMLTLGPGKSKSWDFNASWYMLRAGTYKFSWRIHEIRTNEIVFVRKRDAKRQAPIPGPPVTSQPA